MFALMFITSTKKGCNADNPKTEGRSNDDMMPRETGSCDGRLRFSTVALSDHVQPAAGGLLM